MIPNIIHNAIISLGVAYATGRGIQPKGIRVNDDVTFFVHTENAPPNGVTKAKVIGPGNTFEGPNLNKNDLGGVQTPVTVTKVSDKVHQCQYRPTKVGNYVITVDYSNSPIAESPFKVQVDAEKQSKIRAFGPGLEKAFVGIPAQFTVETNGEISQLG